MPIRSNSASTKKRKAKSPSSTTKQSAKLDPKDTPLSPSANEYKLLCETTSIILEFEPWEFMNETDVFGVQDLTGQIGFVSVMGRLGEYKAIAVYQ